MLVMRQINSSTYRTQCQRVVAPAVYARKLCNTRYHLLRISDHHGLQRHIASLLKPPHYARSNARLRQQAATLGLRKHRAHALRPFVLSTQTRAQ